MSNIIPGGFKSRKVPAHYINEIKITPLVGAGGLTHSLYIRSGEFEFTANFDNKLHHFYDAVSVAMKFFGVKYGIVTVDKEGITRPTNTGMR